MRALDPRSVGDSVESNRAACLRATTRPLRGLVVPRSQVGKPWANRDPRKRIDDHRVGQVDGKGPTLLKRALLLLGLAPLHTSDRCSDREGSN